MFKKYLILIASLGFCLAFPSSRVDLGQQSAPESRTQSDGSTVGRQALAGVFGTALAPIVTAIIGPLLTNLATGISNAFRPGGANGTRITYDAYMFNVPGSEAPYMLLTQDAPFGDLKDDQVVPAFQPLGKVQFKNPIDIRTQEIPYDVQQFLIRKKTDER